MRAKLKFISLTQHFTLCPQALRQTLAMDTKDVHSHWGKGAMPEPLQPVMGGGAASSTEEGPLMKPQPPLGEGSIHKEPILELEGTVYEEGERSIPGKGNPNYRL